MDRGQALVFVREHGVVLVSASGPAPKLPADVAAAAKDLTVADALATLGPWAGA